MHSALVIDSLSFQYPQGKKGIGPLSMKFEKGDAVLIKGKSGCGKSTLARCMTGLIPHLYHGLFSGAVYINGMQTDRTPLWELSERVGFLFQNPAFQVLTATVEEEIFFGLENLGLSKEEMKNRLEEELVRFNLVAKRHQPPQTLSGGEQQKLAMASVMARRPEIIVLDEPLSMLDSTSAVELVQHIRDRAEEGKTAIICEHRIEYFKTIPELRIEPLGDEHDHLCMKEMVSQIIPENRVDQVLLKDITVEKGGRKILNRINVTLKAGCITALVGRNGTGKTTLLRTLAGFQRFEGKIEFGGNPETLQFGMVFQNPDLQLFNATVREEILFRVPVVNADWYHWLIDTLEIAQNENTPPLLLSEGEKRRVALATVLMRCPGSGILLDEPALGQDSTHKQILLRLLSMLAREGMVVVIATHDLELASLADEMILLNQEGIVSHGKAKDIIKDGEAWEKTGLVRPQWLNFPS